MRFNPGCFCLTWWARDHFCYLDIMRADIIYDQQCLWTRAGLHHAALVFVQPLTLFVFLTVIALSLSSSFQLCCLPVLRQFNLFCFSPASYQTFLTLAHTLLVLSACLHSLLAHTLCCRSLLVIVQQPRPPSESFQRATLIWTLWMITAHQMMSYLFMGCG